MTAHADDWPEHWLPREVASTSCVLLFGGQRYHQLTVSMDDGKTRGRLVGGGYRLTTIHGDPQDPRKDRHGIYRRRVPDGEEHD
jgi:hypothetical protein